MGVNMQESVVLIGKPVPLTGVLTETDSSRRRDTAFILLNSGIMHRVGSCRLSVSIARSVAKEAGLSCLRFDFSGIGDSASRRAVGLTFEQAALHEVIEAMDYLKSIRGVNKFILYGLCSGARIACKTAALDSRVVALIQVDGPCYPTTRSRISYYASRLRCMEGWRVRVSRWLRLGKGARGSGLVLAGSKEDFEIPQFAEDPGRVKVAEQLKALMQRDVRLHCVFTGSEIDFRYRSQYRDCFSDVDFGENLSVEYYPEASHIFTEPHYQQQMVAGIVDWVASLDSGHDVEVGATTPALASLESTIAPQ